MTYIELISKFTGPSILNNYNIQGYTTNYLKDASRYVSLFNEKIGDMIFIVHLGKHPDSLKGFWFNYSYDTHKDLNIPEFYDSEVVNKILNNV